VQHAKTVNGESLIWVVIDSELMQFCADMGREYIIFPSNAELHIKDQEVSNIFTLILKLVVGLQVTKQQMVKIL